MERHILRVRSRRVNLQVMGLPAAGILSLVVAGVLSLRTAYEATAPDGPLAGLHWA